MTVNDEIIDWLNQQDEWLREAAYWLLAKGEQVEGYIEELGLSLRHLSKSCQGPDETDHDGKTPN